MGETTPLTRRGLLKLIGNAAKYSPFVLSRTRAPDKTADEVQVALTDSFESDGISYLPIYEIHSSQKGTIPLPEETSGFFMEYNIIDWVYEHDIHNIYTLPIDELVRVISMRPIDASYLETARQHHFPVAFGDIVRYAQEVYPLIKIASNKDTQQFWNGIYLIVGSALPEATRLALSTKIPKMSRRRFLTLSLAGVGALTGSWLTSNTKMFEEKTIMKAIETDPFNRFLLRLYGMSSNLHPEEPFIFVRNALQALKIKTLAGFTKQTNPHPLIPFDTGAMHGGTEDFIPLPDDFLRLLIAYTNRFYMSQVVKKYTAESVATTRLIAADDSAVFRDLPPLVDKKLLALLRNVPDTPPTSPRPVDQGSSDR